MDLTGLRRSNDGGEPITTGSFFICGVTINSSRITLYFGVYLSNESEISFTDITRLRQLTSSDKTGTSDVLLFTKYI
jgi:hypothetical protein